MSSHATDIARGERFSFGANWSRYLENLDDKRIASAERSLCNLIGAHDLGGKRVLDIGCGSGLFSLAARRLGACVHSFDYDPQSVACTQELKRRYFANDADWQIDEGSALDAHYLAKLGQFEIVYSWGVLHHTGAMWRALDLAQDLVAPGGMLAIALYNDQGWISRYWSAVKRIYNRYPALQPAIVTWHWPYLFGLRWLVRRLKRRPLERGMSLWHDTIDWLGGYPFEVASVDAVVRFFANYGLQAKRFVRCGNRLGCNEFVFVRTSQPAIARLAA
jgi:SAM-dependent methyltransferase